MDLPELLADILRRLGELERRQRSQTRTGTVTEVDAASGKVRIRLTEAGLITGWIPWEEAAAGSAKTHMPPSIGQQVRVRSESGDLTDATVQGSVNSDANQRPSAEDDEYVMIDVGMTRITVTGGGDQVAITVGASAITVTNDAIVLACGGSALTVSGEGIAAAAARIDLN